MPENQRRPEIIDAAIEAAPAGRWPELATLQLRRARLAEANTLLSEMQG